MFTLGLYIFSRKLNWCLYLCKSCWHNNRVIQGVAIWFLELSVGVANLWVVTKSNEPMLNSI